MKAVMYECSQGHRVGLQLDSRLADEVRARRAKNKTCEVGLSDGHVCGALAKEVGEKIIGASGA
jgi:hypothetical protein